MDFEELALFIVVLLPLASLCFGLTLRLAIKPFVETLSGVLSQHRPPAVEQTAELKAMRAQLYELTEAVSELRGQVAFDRQLVSGPGKGEAP